MLFTIAFFTICLSLLLVTIIFITSKRFLEKLLCLNTASSMIIAIIIIMSLFENNESYIDVAIIYALFSVVANIGICKIYKRNKE